MMVLCGSKLPGNHVPSLGEGLLLAAGNHSAMAALVRVRTSQKERASYENVFSLPPCLSFLSLLSLLSLSISFFYFTSFLN